MLKPGGPGWNDPPKLTHQVHSETKNRRNLLNKRVAYLGDSLPKTSQNDHDVLLSHGPPLTDKVSKTDAFQVKATTSSLPSTLPKSIFVPHTENCDNVSQTAEAKLDIDSNAEVKKLESNNEIVPTLLSLAEKCKTDKVAMLLTFFCVDFNKYEYYVSLSNNMLL